MADNDISRNYALNIEVSVDSQSLAELRDIKSSTQVSTQQTQSQKQTSGTHNNSGLMDADAAIAAFENLYNNSSNEIDKQIQVQQAATGEIKELSTNISKLSSDVQQLISELKNKNQYNQNQFVNSAANVASGEISRSVATEIMRAVNSVLSPIVNRKFNKSHMSGKDDLPALPSEQEKIDSAHFSSSIEATTGKKVSIIETQMKDSEYGEYDHAGTIRLNRGKSFAVKNLTAEHESLHVAQESKGYTGNNLLFKANANTSELRRSSAEYANEYVTNTIALIKSALSKNIDSSKIEEIVAAYNDAISGKSGVIVKNIESFTRLIKRISGLKVSPETFISNVGSDISSIYSGNGTYLSSAASLAGYHTSSNGVIRGQNGRPVSEKQLLSLRSIDGKRINPLDIYSHQMAYQISSSANTLRGIGVLGKQQFMRNTANEFGSMRDYGIGLMPISSLRRIDEDRSRDGTTWQDVQRRVRKLTETTHRGKPLYTDEDVVRTGSTLSTRLRLPGNVQYNLGTPLEKIMFAVAGKKGLNNARLEQGSGVNFSKQEILNYLKSYVFEGTNLNEGKLMSSRPKMYENYGKVIATIERQLNTLLESDSINLPNTFLGTNAMNTRLGDLAFYVRALKRGVKRGFVPGNLERVRLESSPETVNDEGKKMSLIDNVSEGHLVAKQASLQELADTSEYEEKKAAYEKAMLAISQRRKELASGDSPAKMLDMSGAHKAGLIRRKEFNVGNLSQLNEVEQALNSSYSKFQRHNRGFVMQEKVDELRESLRKIVFMLHPNENVRDISDDRLNTEAVAVMKEIMSMPDDFLKSAPKDLYIPVGNVGVKAGDLIKIKNSIVDYNSTKERLYGKSSKLATSHMESSDGIYSESLRLYRNELRKREEQLRGDKNMSQEEWDLKKSEILGRDTEYQDMLKQLAVFESLSANNAKSKDSIDKAKNQEQEQKNKALSNPINAAFDKNKAAVMGSVYENTSGAYNLAVGNFDSLSVQTGAKDEVLKEIRKNASYMNFTNNDGTVKDFAGPLFGALSGDARNRMQLLEGPMKRIIELSNNISGNAPKRVLSMRELLSKYLHRGEIGPERQLQSSESLINAFSSILQREDSSDTSVDAEKMKELFSAMHEFNVKSETARRGIRGMSAAGATKRAAEIANNDLADNKRNTMSNNGYNRILNEENSDYINEGNELLRDAGIVLSSTKYKIGGKQHYKIVSGESADAGDFASGASTGSKSRLEGVADYLLKKHQDRALIPYRITYKDNLVSDRYDLGDLSKYTSEQIESMIKATQLYGFRNNPNAQAVTVGYKKDGKTMSPETTVRSNDAIDNIEMLSLDRGSELGDKRFVRWLRDHNRAVGAVGTNAGINNGTGIVNNSDIAREFSNNIRILVERALNGGASSSVINKIAEDVSAIRFTLSGGTINNVDSTTQKTGKFRKPSRMSAVDDLGGYEEDVEKTRRQMANAERELTDDNKTKKRDTDYNTDNRRTERAIFEADLASKQTKREKLAFIDERLSKILEDEKSAKDEDKNKIMQEYHRLRKRRIEIENGLGTKQDRIEFKEWKSEQERHGKEFMSSLSGKNISDISSSVAEEIKRLLNLSEMKSIGNYDKKAEISRIVSKLREFEQAQLIKHNKASVDSSIRELKRRYTSEDNAFDATIKGMSIDTRPEKLRNEIERLNSSLKELKRLKDEALSSGNERLAGFYSTLEFNRGTRKSVLEGKLNRSLLSESQAKQAAEKKAELDAQKFVRDTQKEHGRMISLHEREGNQARNIFAKGIEYSAMATMVYSISREIKNAVDTMSRFEKQMLEVTRVMDPLYQAQERLSESAKRLADRYGVSIIEVAKGMAIFAQQGKNATQVVQLTEASLLAANTTTMNAAQATEALTSALRQFNLSDSDAKKVIDSWLEVESRTAIQAGTMADAIKISGTAARIAGLSFHEFNGILSAVGSATRETGSQLGTAFKFIISKMNTEDAVNALQKIGVATHNQNGDLRDLMLRLSDVNDKWQSMTTEQRASLAITIAGTRRYNTFMTLMERWSEALDAIAMSEDSHGKAMRMNAMIMDTYEKRVQKTKASIESFYASMSKDTTRGFLGNIQKSIEMLAKLGEKSSVIGSLMQVGIVAGGFGLFHRLGGSMGISTALEDLGIKEKANNKVTDYFARERAISFGANPNSWAARNFAVGNDVSRRLYMDRLNSLAPEMQFNQITGRNENHNAQSDAIIKRLTDDAFPHLRGKENTEAYVVAKDKIRTQFEKELIRQSEYTSALDESSLRMRGFGARLKSVTEYLGKHAVALQGFGIALQSISNARIFEDKNSITGKNFFGESIDLAGTAASSLSTALLTGKLLKGVKGGGKIGAIVGLLLAIPKFIETIESWWEKGVGSERVSMQRLQKESDRLKTINTSVSTYQRLRKRELSGEVLNGSEIGQKESAAEMIAMSSYGSTKTGHRGLGYGLDEKEIDRLAGLSGKFSKDRSKYDEELSFKAIFSSDSAERIRTNLWRAQERRDKLSDELREFDSSHTGPLSKREMDKRADLFSNYTSAQEDVQKYQQELTKAMEPYLLLIEKSGKSLSDRIRRGDSTVESVGTSEKSRQMYEELLKAYNGNLEAVRNVIARRLIGSNYQRGQVENSESAINNYQKTGRLHMLRKVGDSGNKSTIILRTYDSYGTGYSDQKFEIEKAGNASAYIEKISKLTGIAKDALLYTGDLSDALFRYNLKEIEKFSEISRKLGETISNSFKEQMDRVNSISKISTKYSFVSVEKQYKGFDKQLSDYSKASREYVKGIGVFNKEIVSEIAKNVNSQNPSEAISNAARISSRISGERNLLGIGYSAMNNLVVSSQKSSMASQIMDAIANNKVKRGTDTDVDGQGQENSQRINEYLKESGLGFESVESLQSQLSGKSEEEIKKFLSERVLAAAEMYAKKDAESVAKSLKTFEKALDDAAEKLKNINGILENNRKRNLAISISNNGSGGIINDSDIINSYASMAGKETPVDAIVNSQKQGLKVLESFKEILSATLEKEESRRAEIYKATEGKTDQSSILRRKMADESVARAAKRLDDVGTQVRINAEKISELERVASEQKAILTASYGEFKVFMRNLESQSIKSFDFSDINFGVGSQQFDQIKTIDKQNAELNRKLSEFTSRLEFLNSKKSLTDDEKRERTELRIKVGEIEAKLGANGKILESANESLLKIHAEAIKRTRQAQIEHFANVLSKSKDTGRTQKEIFNQDYKNTKDLFNHLAAYYGNMSNSQKDMLKELGERMETLRDIGDLNGNPSFNKQYLLASAQDMAIVDQIMQRRESGETMKQIFSDAGMKELGRSNPLVSQLLDNLMQKEQNQRLLDTNNNMLSVQEEMLKLLSIIAQQNGDSVLYRKTNLANERFTERNKKIPGFAIGTRYSGMDTGPGGENEPAQLALIHKNEKLAVLSGRALSMYPTESKRALKAISDMNEGRFTGFSKGTRLIGDVFDFGGEYAKYRAPYGGRGVTKDDKIEAYIPPDVVRDVVERFAKVMKVSVKDIYISIKPLLSTIAGFNQKGDILINNGLASKNNAYNNILGGANLLSTVIHEIAHGAENVIGMNSQHLSTDVAQEVMSTLSEMAITGAKIPGYTDNNLREIYSGLKLGFKDPAENLMKVFEELSKGKNFETQIKSINTMLNDVDADRRTGKVIEYIESYRHALAQTAGSVAEYSRLIGKTGNIDKMFDSLDRLLKTVNGKSTFTFSPFGTGKKEITSREYAEEYERYKSRIARERAKIPALSDADNRVFDEAGILIKKSVVGRRNMALNVEHPGEILFDQNISGIAMTEAGSNAELKFKYGRGFAGMSPIERAMTRVHEEVGHGSMWLRSNDGSRLRRDTDAYGLASPEFFADLSAIAVGRRPFTSSAYQTERSNELVKSLNLSSKKSAVHAYLELQKELIKHPEIVREQLVHIQTADQSRDPSIRHGIYGDGFYRAGNRALLPFLRYAGTLDGGEELAEQLMENHKKLAKSVFSRDSKNIIFTDDVPKIRFENYRKDIDDGKLGIKRRVYPDGTFNGSFLIGKQDTVRASDNFRDKYDDLRLERKRNRKYGITIRDGEAYSVYNPIEAIRQSRVADFIRAGGLGYTKAKAVDFATEAARNSGAFALRGYRNIRRFGGDTVRGIGSSVGDFYTGTLRPGISMIPGDAKRAALNIASGTADFGRFTYDKLLSGPVGDLQDISLGGKRFLTEKTIGLRLIGSNMADRARGAKRWFADNFTESGLRSRKRAITDSIRSSRYEHSMATRKHSASVSALESSMVSPKVFEEFGNGYLGLGANPEISVTMPEISREGAIAKQVANNRVLKELSLSRGKENIAYARKNLPSINRKLALIDGARSLRDLFTYDGMRNSRLGKSVRLRSAIISQGIEDFGKSIRNFGGNVKNTAIFAKNRYAEDFRNNFEITKGIGRDLWNKTGGDAIVGGRNFLREKSIGARMALEDASAFGRKFVGEAASLGRNFFTEKSIGARMAIEDASIFGRKVASGVASLPGKARTAVLDFVDYMRPSNIEKRMSENVERNRVRLEKSQSMRQHIVDEFNDFVENYAPDKSRIRHDNYSGKNKKKLRKRDRDISVLSEEFDTRVSALREASIKQGEVVRERASKYNRSKALYDFLSPKKNAEVIANARDRVVGVYEEGVNAFNNTVDFGKKMYSSISEEFTPEALMNRRARVLSKGAISGVPGFGPRLTIGQRFRAETYRRAAEFLTSPRDYMRGVWDKTGGKLIRGTGNLIGEAYRGTGNFIGEAYRGTKRDVIGSYYATKGDVINKYRNTRANAIDFGKFSYDKFLSGPVEDVRDIALGAKNFYTDKSIGARMAIEDIRKFPGNVKNSAINLGKYLYGKGEEIVDYIRPSNIEKRMYENLETSRSKLAMSRLMRQQTVDRFNDLVENYRPDELLERNSGYKGKNKKKIRIRERDRNFKKIAEENFNAKSSELRDISIRRGEVIKERTSRYNRNQAIYDFLSPKKNAESVANARDRVVGAYRGTTGFISKVATEAYGGVDRFARYVGGKAYGAYDVTNKAIRRFAAENLTESGIKSNYARQYGLERAKYNESQSSINQRLLEEAGQYPSDMENVNRLSSEQDALGRNFAKRSSRLRRNAAIKLAVVSAPRRLMNLDVGNIRVPFTGAIRFRSIAEKTGMPKTIENVNRLNSRNITLREISDSVGARINDVKENISSRMRYARLKREQERAIRREERENRREQRRAEKIRKQQEIAQIKSDRIANQARSGSGIGSWFRDNFTEAGLARRQSVIRDRIRSSMYEYRESSGKLSSISGKLNDYLYETGNGYLADQGKLSGMRSQESRQMAIRDAASRNVNDMLERLPSIDSRLKAIRTVKGYAHSVGVASGEAAKFVSDKFSGAMSSAGTAINNVRQKISERIESASQAREERRNAAAQARAEKKEAARQARDAKIDAKARANAAKSYRSGKALYNRAGSGNGVFSWFRDNFTESGLTRRKTILENRFKSSDSRYLDSTERLYSERARLNRINESRRSPEVANDLYWSANQKNLADASAERIRGIEAERNGIKIARERDLGNLQNNLPSINKRLATIRAIKKPLNKVATGARNVVNGIRNNFPGTAMQLKMLESAWNSGANTVENISSGKYWEATESGLATIGSLHYAGVLDKIPGGGKLSKIAPAAFYLSGGLELARGIKNGDAGTIVSGAGNIANAALFSRPMQSILGKQVERSFGPGSVARFGKGMGWGMAADLIGTGIEKLGDHYNKPWLKRTGQIVGGVGEMFSDTAVSLSTMGLNKFIGGGIEAGRLLFDDKYRENYGDRRAHVGEGFIALEQVSKLVPGASGAFRMYGVDIPSMLDEMNSNYANAYMSRERDESLLRNRSNLMGSLFRDDKLKYGKNASREDKMAKTAAVFGALKQASKGTSAKGPDATQAAMEAYFRNEDASQMMARYDVFGKKNASVKAQAEIAKLHARLAELDKEDASLTNSDSILANISLHIATGGLYTAVKGARLLFDENYRRNYGEAGYNRRLEERREIEKKLAQLRKAGSFDRKEQIYNTRKAAQEHFDNLFGKKNGEHVNVFGKGGILEELRRKRRDAEVKREEDALSKNQDALVEARNAVFNDDKLTYSYASLADMEHAAKMGDKKAQAELAKFNERASKDKRVTDASGRIAANKKRIADLKGKKIDGEGEITSQDFDDLRRYERTNIEIQARQKDNDIKRLKEQEKRLNADIKIMERYHSSEGAIRGKKAELESLRAQIGTATEERDKLRIDKKVSDRLTLGELNDKYSRYRTKDGKLDDKAILNRKAIRSELAKQKGVDKSKISEEDINAEVERRKADIRDIKSLEGRGVKALVDPRKLAAEAAKMEEQRRVAREILDDPNKLRELDAGKTVTARIGGKNVTLNKEQVQAWRGISDDAIAKKREEQQAAQDAIRAYASEETVRQDIAKKKGVDASKISDKEVQEEVAKRKAEAEKKKKEAEAKEAERRRLASPRGAFDAAKKAFDDAQAAKSKNDKELAGFRSRKKELEGKDSLSDEQKAELADLNKKIESGERRGSVLSGTIASNKAKLERSTLTLMANVRARKNYTSNDEDVANYRKLRDKNSRREALERKRLGDGTKDLKDDERGALSEEEWKELQEARKTREADERAAADAKKAVDEKTKQDETTGTKLLKDREKGLLEGPNGKKYERERRSLALGRLGLVRVKRGKNGDLEAYRERKDETAPTVDQRTEAIESEHTKADASSVQTATIPTVAQGTTARPEAQTSKEVVDISRDAALVAQYMEKLLPIVNNILTVIGQNKGGGQQVAPSGPPPAGTKIPSSGA